MDLQGVEKQDVRTEQIGRPALHDVHPDQDSGHTLHHSNQAHLQTHGTDCDYLVFKPWSWKLERLAGHRVTVTTWHGRYSTALWKTQDNTQRKQRKQRN